MFPSRKLLLRGCSLLAQVGSKTQLGLDVLIEGVGALSSGSKACARLGLLLLDQVCDHHVMCVVVRAVSETVSPTFMRDLGLRTCRLLPEIYHRDQWLSHRLF